jgi:hypothetical protein
MLLNDLVAKPRPDTYLAHSRPVVLSVSLIVATAAAGLIVRFAHLGLPAVVSKYGGSALWALLIYWIWTTVQPRARPLAVAFEAGLLTAAIEVFKLYRSPGLDAFRHTLPGILLLGRVFSAWDILAYWLAISIGVWVDFKLRARAA